VLPEDRADVLYHQYDGGGVKIDGPSLLMRKKFAEKYSVSANYYVDLVSSASIDVVTTASPYKEERQQLGLGFDMLNGKTQYSVGFTNSDENDYTANQASFDISQDMFGDLTTVSFGFSRGWDEVRRRDDDEFSESVDRRTWRLGLSQIVTPTLLLGLSYELVSDEGYLNNPYRSVRYLDPDSPVGYAVPERDLPAHAREQRGIDQRALLPAVSRRRVWRVPLLHRHVGHRLDDREDRLHAPVAREMDLRGWLSLLRPAAADFYSDLFPRADAQNFLARDKELSTFTSHMITVGATYELPPLGWHFVQKSTVNLYYDQILYDYQDFRDVREGGTPGHRARLQLRRGRDPAVLQRLVLSDDPAADRRDLSAGDRSAFSLQDRSHEFRGGGGLAQHGHEITIQIRHRLDLQLGEMTRHRCTHRPDIVDVVSARATPRDVRIRSGSAAA
jgi:hypothetical protein